MGCRNLQGQVRKKSLLGLLFFCQYALPNVSPQYTAVNKLHLLQLNYQTKELFSYTKKTTQGIFDKPIFFTKNCYFKPYSHRLDSASSRGVDLVQPNETDQPDSTQPEFGPWGPNLTHNWVY